MGKAILSQPGCVSRLLSLLLDQRYVSLSEVYVIIRGMRQRREENTISSGGEEVVGSTSPLTKGKGGRER